MDFKKFHHSEIKARNSCDLTEDGYIITDREIFLLAFFFRKQCAFVHQFFHICK